MDLPPISFPLSRSALPTGEPPWSGADRDDLAPPQNALPAADRVVANGGAIRLHPNGLDQRLR
jgi:hypothetical protein